MELLHITCGMTNVWDVINLRQSCKQLHQNIPSKFVARLYNKQTRKLEAEMIESRVDLIRGIRELKLTYTSRDYKLLMTGNIETMINAVKKNVATSVDLKRVHGRYREGDLRAIRFNWVSMNSGMSFIHGDNVWTFTKETTRETIALIPRQLGNDYFCTQCQGLHSYLLVEIVYFELHKGVKNGLENGGLIPFRTSRVVPMFGSRHRFEKLLERINMFPMGQNWNGIVANGYKDARPEGMYLPHIECNRI